MPELETVDIAGVEILAAGGPVHGVGSPPEGDYWSADELQGIADANRALAGELKPPNKIGHSDAQALLLNSGMVAPTPGEMPAVGWLDGSTFRVEPETDGEPAKLLADLKDVPRTFADLIKAKAYRTRSVELSKVDSQDGSGKTYDWVVTGLAWLGAKLPAVRTLDDIVALYAERGLKLAYTDSAVELRWIRCYDTGEVVWDPSQSLEQLRNDVNEALNGPSTGGMVEPRFWVRDISNSKALAVDWYAGDDGDAYVVPFTRGEDGTVTISPSSDWVKAERTWVATTKAFEEQQAKLASGSKRAPADTGPMPYSDDQRRKFAEATGLDADKVTDEMLTSAGVTAETTEPPTPPTPTPPDDDDAARTLEETLALVKKVDDRSRSLEEELRTERRDNFVELTLREGKIAPGQRKTLEALYDANPTAARAFVDEAPANEDLAREYGTDDDTMVTEEQRKLEAEAADADTSARLGIPAGELI